MYGQHPHLLHCQGKESSDLLSMRDLMASLAQGKRLWVVKLPEVITSMCQLDHRPRGFRGVLVALRNREVRVYKDKFLVSSINMDVSLFCYVNVIVGFHLAYGVALFQAFMCIG